MRVLVTGGAGFIGSEVVRQALAAGHEVANLDALTYAAEPSNLDSVADHANYRFFKADLRDRAAVAAVFDAYQPDQVIHLAAESHVDRSIDGPGVFIETNVVGAFNLLQTALGYFRNREPAAQERFRLLHVSTDEVYGALGAEGRFNEDSAHAPNSPYAASKASSDMLARAWSRTYGLPVLISNCSNNYGPRQFPEKLIPVVILNALEGRPIPVYGAGEQVRDWIYVGDHASALLRLLADGRPGETYCIGGGFECRNIDLVRMICSLMDGMRPRPDGAPHADLIRFVADRPGHDFRYAIDASKIKCELGWMARVGLEDGLRETVQWYLDNVEWWTRIRARGDAVAAAGGRIGLAERSAR